MPLRMVKSNEFDDGNTASIYMYHEHWRFIVSSSLVADTPAVVSDQPTVLIDMFLEFKNKPFLQYLPSFVSDNFYDAKEVFFY